MIKGIGVDIIEIDRVKQAVEEYGDKFLKKVFTKKEIAYCRVRKQYRYPELAVRFAAKEAYSKALGIGVNGLGRGKKGLDWLDVEVVNNALGKPYIAANSQILENVHVSLSHNHTTAVAQVVIEG